MSNDYNEILQPTKVWSRSEILSRECPVPRKPGVYAWYFREFPPEIQIPTDGCITYGELSLLYVGIAPKAPPRNARPPNRRTLYDRIRDHMRGNAEGSTLRLSLGCLLSESLGIELRRVGRNGKSMTFAEGEQMLSEWMAHNAFVVWIVTAEPWKLEEELIRTLSLPLNLNKNKSHAFCPILSAKRKNAKAKAQDLPVVHAT